MSLNGSGVIIPQGIEFGGDGGGGADFAMKCVGNPIELRYTCV